jgi:hypothetical protein
MEQNQLPKVPQAVGCLGLIFAPIRFIFSSFLIGACIKILRNLLR